MLVEDMVMFSFLMESVVVSFTLGGVIGAVVATHLLHPKKESIKFEEQEGEYLESRPVLQRDISARMRIPPRR